MAKGARPKRDLSMKLDTKFRGTWYAEEDLKDKLLTKFSQLSLDTPLDDFGNEDIEGIIELAYEKNISV